MSMFFLIPLMACDSNSEATRSGAAEQAQAPPGDASGSGDSDSDSETSAPLVVEIVSPQDQALVDNPVTFNIEAASGVALVALDADGWALGDPWDPAQGSSLTYSFSGTGYSRLVTLSGYDSAGQLVASDSISITVDGGVSDAIPYYYQYDNLYEPSATCGLTSTAMVLSYWTGTTITPDALYLEYGKEQGQSPTGIEALYSWHGLYGTSTTTGTRDQIRSHLDAGRTVIAHGFWTSAGHILVIVDHDDSGWIVNDPAGDWFVCYGCNVSGEQVRYPYGSTADEALSHDGDIWFSVADSAPL